MLFPYLYDWTIKLRKKLERLHGLGILRVNNISDISLPPCLLCGCACLTCPILQPYILMVNTLKMVLSRFKFSLLLAKSRHLLTQTVSHPALWHRIEPTPSGCALSPHRHRDRPLMSLHLRLRPRRVGSVSKNKASDSGGSGTVIGMRLALAVGATKTWRSARKVFLAWNFTHHYIPSLAPLRHCLSLSQLVSHRHQPPTLPPRRRGCCKSHRSSLRRMCLIPVPPHCCGFCWSVESLKK